MGATSSETEQPNWLVTLEGQLGVDREESQFVLAE